MMKEPINKFCPRSGKYVQADSLTTYRGHTVGFCNPHCSQDFAANPDAHPSDRAYFDTLLKEYELATE
ncbi:MAG: YHS domain-containing protein [Cyanobacteria bacterium J06656_5]